MAQDFLGIAGNYLFLVLGGILILLIGFALGILAKKLSYKVLRNILHLNRVMGKVGFSRDLEKILSNVLSYLIYLITLVFFLDHLGITSVVLYIILGAVLALAVLTFLVGLKDVIPNLVAWVILQRREKLVVGHKINVREIAGTIERTGYLETEIKTENGDILYVPNALFLKSKLRVKKEE